MSTTSVAVVYAVMVETGLNSHDLGKLILAACFVTDLGTVLALGGLFANYGWLLPVFAVVTPSPSPSFGGWSRFVIDRVGHRVASPSGVPLRRAARAGWLATAAGSEAVLPAYFVGLIVAGVFMDDRVLLDRIRTIAFALLTPVLLPARRAAHLRLRARRGSRVIALLFLVKMVTKFIGVWPIAAAFGSRPGNALTRRC